MNIKEEVYMEDPKFDAAEEQPQECSDSDSKVDNLQKNLKLIREHAGLNCSDLARKLGVSRQMINNLEKQRNKMTKMQYLAIRQVLAEEIKEAAANGNDTKMLAELIHDLVDEPNSVTDEIRESILKLAETMAPLIVSKKSRKSASLALAVALGAIVGATGVKLFDSIKEKR